MKSIELNRQLQKIYTLIEFTTLSTNENLELQGHWGKYICVLSAGFLENAISAIYIKLVSDSSSPSVAAFTSRTLKRIQNPKASKFIEIAGAFKKEWRVQIEKLFEETSSTREAIDSIMANRHLIVHGKNTSISVARVKEYLKKSVTLIEFIEEQCGFEEHY